MNKRLAWLRYKTDRELFILAERQLEQTLGLAQIGHIDDAAHGLRRFQRLQHSRYEYARQRWRGDVAKLVRRIWNSAAAGAGQGAPGVVEPLSGSLLTSVLWRRTHHEGLNRGFT